MIIKDVMTRDVLVVTKNTSVQDAARLIIEKKLHALPVVDAEKPVGIVTETDFFTKGNFTTYLPDYIDFLKKDPSLQSSSGVHEGNVQALLDAQVKDIMSAPCITINEDSDLHELLGLIKGRNLNSVPVVNSEGFLVGIVTISDIIALMRVV